MISVYPCMISVYPCMISVYPCMISVYPCMISVYQYAWYASATIEAHISTPSCVWYPSTIETVVTTFQALHLGDWCAESHLLGLIAKRQGMRECLYVCVYVCICMFACHGSLGWLPSVEVSMNVSFMMNISKYMHNCVCIYIHIHIYMCVCVCVCVCQHTCMHTYIYIYIYIHINWGA
jgi:hypothetical protein